MRHRVVEKRKELASGTHERMPGKTDLFFFRCVRMNGLRKRMLGQSSSLLSRENPDNENGDL